MSSWLNGYANERHLHDLLIPSENKTYTTNRHFVQEFFWVTSVIKHRQAAQLQEESL